MKDREKYQVLSSIHFVHAFIDVHGMKRTHLFADEASWRLRHESIQVGGAGTPGLLVSAAAQQPPQMMPIPMWEVIQGDLRSGYATVTLVPVELAYVRNARRCVKGETGMEIVNHAEYDRRMKDAALVRGVGVEH